MIIPIDKQLHFLWSFFIAVWLYKFIGAWGLLVALCVGITKETYDELKYNGFDVWDLIADLAGIFIGGVYICLRM